MQTSQETYTGLDFESTCYDIHVQFTSTSPTVVFLFQGPPYTFAHQERSQYLWCLRHILNGIRLHATK